MNAGRGWLARGAALTLLALVAAAVAAHFGASTARCPGGAVALGPRCCGEGQSLVEGRCQGEPSRCPDALRVTAAGCVAPTQRVRIDAGAVGSFPPDWEAAGRDLPQGSVPAFEIDAFEVTEARWTECASAGPCAPRPDEGEPGTPVRDVSATEAAAFCAFAGGRLPTPEEHAMAASGAEGRRYPWGFAGVVCRNASFGLVVGPCAEGASKPELAGMRPDGATAGGVHDLAGNVAEWTLAGRTAFARGGSFRSTSSTALRAWSSEPTPPDTRRDDLGFRCAYPLTSTASKTPRL
ncbi:MAG: SUMF1/EgtB/PvdO family nonheme iron enzyme [Myxococcales bacterium]|nr:SUMF1/EgtB/PvdO family nonheme iron enzyme [Myxococcales bacterium]